MQSAGKPFAFYRIILTVNGKALTYGSDYPTWANRRSPKWYERGQWGKGSFWRSSDTVRHHLRNLCHDWRHEYRTSGTGSYQYSFVARIRITEAPDYSRLKLLRVEQTLITEHTAAELDADDFMHLVVSEET